MYPNRIVTTLPIKLIGKRIKTSLTNNKTSQLWQSFMPLRGTIPHVVSTNLFSVTFYDERMDFAHFNPKIEFEKWAAVEVSDFDNIPESMESCVLESGLYAVFTYCGVPSEAAPFFEYIFTRWIPSSGYQIDNRAHFEVLGEKYRHNDRSSEEEVWIPIKHKNEYANVLKHIFKLNFMF